MSVHDVNVLPVGDRWKVERGGEEIATFEDREQAIDTARREAEGAHTDLVIYGHDGQIRTRQSFAARS